MAVKKATPNKDKIIGTSKADKIDGLAGNDTLQGMTGMAEQATIH